MNPILHGQPMKDLLGPEVKRVLMIIPDPESFPSGGNIYNRRWMDAMDAQGLVVTCAEDISAYSDQQLKEIDVMMLDSLYLSDAYQSFWDRYPDKKKVIIFHHLPCLELELEDQKPCFEAYRAYFDQADKIWVTSDFSKKWLAEQGLLPSKIISHPPAVSWSIPERQPKTKSLFTGLIVANLIPRKGILSFLQALIAAGEIDLPFELQIAGSDRLDPGYAEACKSCVTHSPYLSDKVHFLGEIKPENMLSVYQKADILISASSMETFGMALQEAKYMGLPILALGSKTEGGNIHTFIQEEEGDKLYPDMKDLAIGFLNVTHTFHSSKT